MGKKQYLSKFSRSAGWRLGAAEAEEAIRDYRELVYQEGRDEAKLIQELGDPVQAAWMLTDARSFKRWRWVFGILVCCALFIAGWAWDGLPFYWRIWHNSMDVWVEFVQVIAPLVVGLPLAVVWFRRDGHKAGPVSMWLLLAAAAVALAGGAMLFQVWRCFDVQWVQLGEDGFGPTTAEHASAVGWTIYVGSLSALAGALGLLPARYKDRRWAALFILGLTVSVLCVACQCTLLAADPYLGAIEMSSVRAHLFGRLAPVGIAGLIGTGAVLC